ncbi:MAG: TetR/AcrR family transcriptional regulator [Treponema sp.]|nr:TetR/AcrR family transcriptional regulator [Treponema sp.]
MDELSGTKELIFDNFIELTSTFGYENVTMRDIADKVGIQVASIYNHFDTKAKILEYAYDYGLKHQYDNRKPVDEMKKLIETADAQELIQALVYTFESEDQKKYVRMVLITKIIFMRLFQDPVANSMFAEINNSNAEYIVSILEHGISLGRIDPDFDLNTFSDILLGALQIMGIKSFAGTQAYVVNQLDQEKRILRLVTRLLSTALK